MTFFYYIIFLYFLILLIFEIQNNLNKNSPLTICPDNWMITSGNTESTINGLVKISNPSKKIEIMIPKFKVETKLLSKTKINNLKIETEIIPKHPDHFSLLKDYWVTYIVKRKSTTEVFINIQINHESNLKLLEDVESIWVDIIWSNYGPNGIINRQDGFVIPQKISKAFSETKIINKNKSSGVIPVKTHILGRLDDPIDILDYYLSDQLIEGDIITIGETPLAIMQGRYISSESINETLLARLLCKSFHPTSSLATAYGMQTLINIIGPTRAITSWMIAGFLKLLSVKGIFYILAGNQARLIDDITGTTAPYDKNIVFGPNNLDDFCRKVYKKFKSEIAIVDVNDLGKVKILSSSKNCDLKLLELTLKSNPAGNGDEHTPIVIVRPN